MKKFKPNLSATIDKVEALAKLRYPLIALPKHNGIRIVLHKELGAVSRSLKPIPNLPLRQKLEELMKEYPQLVGAELEFTVNGGILEDAKSIFSSHRKPVLADDITLWLFDNHNSPNLSLWNRLTRPTSIYINEPNIMKFSIQRVEIREVRNAEEAELEYNRAISAGLEGLMLRCPSAPYKYGRSTLREQGMMKLKPMFDAEALIIGFEEGTHNCNAPELDNLGRTKRSSSAAGKIGSDTLGAFLVQIVNGNLKGVRCKLSAKGMPHHKAQEIWNNREKYRGQHCTLEYRSVGSQGKPKEAVFKGIRKLGE